MLHPDFVKPQYNHACFADIPASIKHLLTGEGELALSTEIFNGLPQQYEAVILFFVDAFGWRFFEAYKDRYPFLQELVANGKVNKLTSQFPSTTAAHVTTIHTGLSASQSGVYEWQYYEPQLDVIITPLLFSLSGTKERDLLKQLNADPQKLYPTQTLYQDLKAQGVESHVFQFAPFANSPYSEVVMNGAKISSYATISEGLVNLRQLLLKRENPAYYFLYFSQIDSIGHSYGPETPQFEAEVDTFFTALERLFLSQLKGKLKNTLLMLTADHGQTTTHPKTTVYLDRDPRFAGFERFIRPNRQGELLIPAGSSRDMFLYIKEDLLDEAHAFLAERLSGAADVVKTADLIAAGYFGPQPPAKVFLERLGNLVVLPYDEETVWWMGQEDKFKHNLIGHHGGLSKAEMEIPLLLYPF